MNLKAPTETNKYYIKTSYGGYNKCILINSYNGSVLPNCVGYAYGRFMEIGGVTSCNLPTCNAEDWYYNSRFYEHGNTPKKGAVMCWKKGKTGNVSDGAGHVAIVEEVLEDGTVITSESNYGGERWFTKTRKKPYPIAGQSFMGFIYNPYVTEEKPVEDIEQVARDVIAGKYGNGELRKINLERNGYNYEQVQNKVNEIMAGNSLEQVARDVIAGKYGNGELRKIRLRIAGYDPVKVQNIVNRMMKEGS